MDTSVCRALPHAHPGHGHTLCTQRAQGAHTCTDTHCLHTARTPRAAYDCAHEHRMILPPAPTGHSQRTRGCSPNPQCWWVQPGVRRAARGLASPPPLRVLWVLSPASQPQSVSRGHRGAHRQVQTHPLLQHTPAHAGGPRGPVRRCERAPKLRERSHRGASPAPSRREMRVRTRHTQPGRAGGRVEQSWHLGSSACQCGGWLGTPPRRWPSRAARAVRRQQGRFSRVPH